MGDSGKGNDVVRTTVGHPTDVSAPKSRPLRVFLEYRTCRTSPPVSRLSNKPSQRYRASVSLRRPYPKTSNRTPNVPLSPTAAAGSTRGEGGLPNDALPQTGGNGYSS